ncbi:hypothetical protein OYC64_007704 [Pagothenia borchgrevinki]|uniref:HAT C-terminal dimerisation domain-containing protein n=1 Tax=Pagothenia borchgrevinki TaxID=8213 RepID=A0ABD2GTF1_PAGBO
MMQSEEMDLQTAVQLVNTAKECVEALRTEKVFTEMWSECAQEREDDTIHPGPTKRRQTLNTTLEDYVVEETVGVGTQENHQMTEQRRLFYSCIDAVTGEIARRFGERNSAFMEAIASLNPESSFFLEPEKVEPLLKLTGTTLVDAEFIVAKKLILKHVDSFTPPEDGKWTLKKVLGHLHTTLEAMPSVLTAFKVSLTFGASIVLCENSFSILKNVFSEHRRSMSHTRKANLIQLGFEKDLTKKCKNEWKDMLLRRFHSSGKRRLQLY